MVYAGSSRALCQLEKRVHCNGFAPKGQALMRLELPKTAALKDVQEIGLDASWRQDESITQVIGMNWLAPNASLGLWVPSYIEPQEKNLLLNPQHPQYTAIKLVTEQFPFVFDPRLFE
jgi:RES domain-containing protein